ncbi:uncharacterized protein SPSK_05611 [Sporothrix schenckii 1099-18]|uniref:Uncharacterized protein n=1 Tax=Sporothrix schenckii 1099-18 TaxID=1397361 RepID=A0A0F2LX39_SPOSC|nr:uncharacterized protein SPSK_05611 [Sporothrix schenckii 1099-18]KJR81060.1 hypothetical protein SPSK_05611 [Sporothrix schenckii 1099-18]
MRLSGKTVPEPEAGRTNCCQWPIVAHAYANACGDARGFAKLALVRRHCTLTCPESPLTNGLLFLLLPAPGHLLLRSSRLPGSCTTALSQFWRTATRRTPRAPQSAAVATVYMAFSRRPGTFRPVAAPAVLGNDRPGRAVGSRATCRTDALRMHVMDSGNYDRTML